MKGTRIPFTRSQLKESGTKPLQDDQGNLYIHLRAENVKKGVDETGNAPAVVSGLKDLKNTLTRIMKDYPDKKIRVLEISGHGNEFHIRLGEGDEGDKVINKDNAKAFGKWLKKIFDFTEDARIYLSACGTGRLK